MAEPDLDPDLVVVEIDYKPGTRDPGRVFRSMSALIEAFHAIDRDLARSVSMNVRVEVLLERVEAGSVRAILRTIIEQASDDALMNLQWQPLVGQYLVRGKHAILDWLKDREQIDHRGEILGLQQTLAELAPKSHQELLPPGTVPVERLLEDVRLISEGVVPLQPEDTAVLVSKFDATSVETRIRITEADVVRLLTDRTASSESVLTLLVKKPDYLGRSMWEFRVGEQTIEARILDEAWLADFQAGRVTLRPGDALRAIVQSEVMIGFEGDVVDSRHEVQRVIAVVPNAEGEQGGLGLKDPA